MPAGSAWVLREARGLNDNGVIVGWGAISNGMRGFAFNNGQVTDLGVLPGGTNSYALAVNNSVSVIGVSSKADAPEHAFIWKAGTMRDLNSLHSGNTKWILRQARGINDQGQILGLGELDGRDRAFLLVPRAESFSSFAWHRTASAFYRQIGQ